MPAVCKHPLGCKYGKICSIAGRCIRLNLFISRG